MLTIMSNNSYINFSIYNGQKNMGKVGGKLYESDQDLLHNSGYYAFHHNLFC
jgi:hypothetical protein